MSSPLDPWGSPPGLRTLHCAVQIPALRVVISLCSWARHFTLKLPQTIWSVNGYLEFSVAGEPCDGLANQRTK